MRLCAKKKPLRCESDPSAEKGENRRLKLLSANETRQTQASKNCEKPRKRGIRQREGVPPSRMRQDAAAYDAHRRRRPEPHSGVAALACVGRELPQRNTKQAVGEFEIPAFRRFPTLLREL
jgi:hypothetical protein